MSRLTRLGPRSNNYRETHGDAARRCRISRSAVQRHARRRRPRHRPDDRHRRKARRDGANSSGTRAATSTASSTRLDSGDFDCVASGTTITGSRALKAAFCDPYLISGQALAVDTTRLPDVPSIDDLEGLTIGVQQGNTSQPIANRLLADGKVARVRVYDYGSIRTALRDLTTGSLRCVHEAGPGAEPNWSSALPGVDGGPARHHHREDRDRGAHHRHRAAGAGSTSRRPNSRRTARCRAIRERWTGSPRADQSGPQSSDHCSRSRTPVITPLG